mmetsp:Transcript_26164/g.65036  ORF Transcript_26164/g.65036 Transcript_26164/m.65036 type:complete len:80 (+) Transcript_26164:2441-2680(+)
MTASRSGHSVVCSGPPDGTSCMCVCVCVRVEVVVSVSFDTAGRKNPRRLCESCDGMRCDGEWGKKHDVRETRQELSTDR